VQSPLLLVWASLVLIWSTWRITCPKLSDQNLWHNRAVYFFTYVMAWGTVLILLHEYANDLSIAYPYLLWSTNGCFALFFVLIYIGPRISHNATYLRLLRSFPAAKVTFVLACILEVSGAFSLFVAGYRYLGYRVAPPINDVISGFCNLLGNCPAGLKAPIAVPSLTEILVTSIVGIVSLFAALAGFSTVMYIRGFERGRRQSNPDPSQPTYT
jgi:hypothetical protein